MSKPFDLSPRKKIAVVGSGCSGIAALWALKATGHDLYLYEANNRLGGHTNTVNWNSGKNSVDVDTGFIVLNTATYPNFINFLKILNIETEPTRMDLSVSRDHGSFEWSGQNLASVFCQAKNLFSVQMWRMLFDIVRFNQLALDVLIDDKAAVNGQNIARSQIEETIGAYLVRNDYSDAFKYGYLVPITAAVWSTSPNKCVDEFPIRTLVRFLWNHHQLSTVSTRPEWLTLKNGSKTYFEAVMKDFPSDHVFINSPVSRVNNDSSGRVEVHLSDGSMNFFDHVILATHANQALSILGSSATSEERSILSCFKTSQNEVVLHSDTSHMPVRRSAWSSWNYMTLSPRSEAFTDTVSLTYNMNILQHVPENIFGHVLVTLNPLRQTDPSLTQGRFEYSHPLYTSQAVRAQGELHKIQNKRGISFAGAWTNYGFHEDGFSSGLRIAQDHLGAELPFDIVESSLSRGKSPTLGLADHLMRVVIAIIHVFLIRPLDILLGRARSILNSSFNLVTGSLQGLAYYPSRHFEHSGNPYLCAGNRGDLLSDLGPIDSMDISAIIYGLHTSWILTLFIVVSICCVIFSAQSSAHGVWEGPGQPYLIPCRTTHTRFFPKKHSFSYSYLTVGIPVVYRNEAFGMISVEEQKHHLSTGSWSISRWFRQSWYTIRACDYLQRSDQELSLRQKLDMFLQAERQNPTDYPHAYLITAPRFAGYSFNPVSLWYLYSSDKILSAMILEVNNTYDERRPYLILRDSNSEKAPGSPAQIQGFRVKDFYVSPFNSRRGLYSVVSTDPLGPGMSGFSGVDVKITLNSSKGHPKLVARLFSEGQAIDLSTLGCFSKLGFLARWSWIGLATAPRIMKEGVTLMFRQKLRMHNKPEPLLGTLGRHPTSNEKILEKTFRRQLEHLVTSSSAPLTVHYFTSGFISEGKEIFTSPLGKNYQDRNLLEIRILSPAFYCRIIRYDNVLDGILSEMEEQKTVSVNRPEVLAKLFGT
ncbi:hypothetical protein VTL71DRAFT_8716 [Oculimacula yallundae]|uniref:Amine oxidase domain-containing protein n=1 Tax=Oculimacula yallundae TaxID=86028 RepID=A0ABR4CYJ5_9HELO